MPGTLSYGRHCTLLPPVVISTSVASLSLSTCVCVCGRLDLCCLLVTRYMCGRLDLCSLLVTQYVCVCVWSSRPLLPPCHSIHVWSSRPLSSPCHSVRVCVVVSTSVASLSLSMHMLLLSAQPSDSHHTIPSSDCPHLRFGPSS